MNKDSKDKEGGELSTIGSTTQKILMFSPREVAEGALKFKHGWLMCCTAAIYWRMGFPARVNICGKNSVNVTLMKHNNWNARFIMQRNIFLQVVKS